MSSKKQSEDLERQINYLKEIYPEFQVIKEIGSGLNFERRGLQELLEKCSQGIVERVVVTNKDRLARYGNELILWIFEKFGVKLIVQFKDLQSEEQDELSEDIVNIITICTARYYGKKSAESKRRRKAIEGENRQKEEVSGEEE